MKKKKIITPNPQKKNGKYINKSKIIENWKFFFFLKKEKESFKFFFKKLISMKKKTFWIFFHNNHTSFYNIILPKFLFFILFYFIFGSESFTKKVKGFEPTKTKIKHETFFFLKFPSPFLPIFSALSFFIFLFYISNQIKSDLFNK